MTGVLIVGGGQAGAQAALTLRELGCAGDITIAGAEAHPPYQRPPLSKTYLSGKASAESLHFRKSAFYEKAGIDIKPDARVLDVELSEDDEDTAGVAYLADDSVVEFEQLMLAVGGRPRRLDIPGAELQGIHYLRTLDDAASLLGSLTTARHLVVVGGGFIGLEAAAMARSRDVQVTVVEAADRLLSRAVDPSMSSFLLQAHTRRGVKVRLGRGVVGFEGTNSTVRSVLLDDGTHHQADAVVIGVGLEPRLELARQLGVATQGGIVVDNAARTSDRRVTAAGDCTVMPNPMTGKGLVRLESVQNAVDQAKVAAATMLGIPAVHNSVPWFWSHQGSLTIQMAGLTEGYDNVLLQGDLGAEQFSLSYFLDDYLIAVHAVNRPKDYLAGRRRLTENGIART